VLREGTLVGENVLASETVDRLSLSLEGVHDVHSSDSLTACVFGVGDRVANDVLEEDLEDSASLFVDETRDTLHTATTCETANGGLGDALDVVAKDLAMALGATLAESLASFAASCHFVWFDLVCLGEFGDL
jgi:hypothetical protein